MDLSRLGNKRAKRSKTWASVCAGLFCNGTSADSTDETDRAQ